MPKPRKIQYNGDSKIVNALVNVANWVLDEKIEDLNNVAVEDLANGQVLKYNATTQKWVNDDGSEVVANPTGTATDTLQTIQIGEDIYEIVGGGGGGGGSFSETVLYTGTTIVSTVELSSSFELYDALHFVTGFPYNGRTYIVSTEFTKQDLVDALANEKWLKMGQSTDSYCYGKVSANNRFTECYGTGYLYSIKGIKYGGGSGGVAYGYDAPTGGSDGDMYILLNANNTKRGEYLYISNAWVLIQGEPPFDGHIYDSGTEYVEIELSNATREADDIEVNNGGGYLNYYMSAASKIDVTDFDELYCMYQFNNTEYEKTVDISSYTGEKYVMFHYFSGYGFNNCAVSLTDTLYTSTTFPADGVIELTRLGTTNNYKTKLRKLILR